MLHVIQLTPPGRGAVTTLRIEGPGALAAVQSHLQTPTGRPLADYPPQQLALGRFGGPTGEEVVVCRHGDDSVDLHCHGGLAAAALIQQTLIADGCQSLAWTQWANSPSADPIRAAAIVAMADARTERTAAILLDQFDGALRRAIDDIHRTLARREFLPARQKIDALLSRSSLGQHLVRAWRVVLAGRPNVGKSSLMNALAGHQRSIVHHEPGTTRDAVTLDTAIDGWPVQLCDTAGLRQANDDLESAGIELARQRLAKADLIVLVCDQSVPWSAADQTLLDQWPGALVVYNKCDLAVGTAATCGINYPPSGLQVSALRGDGIEPLLEAIARRLVPDSPPPGAAVPFMPEQAAEIRAMRELSE